MVLAADVTDAHLQVDDGTAQVQLSLIAGAPDISAAPVGSLISKVNTSATILEYKSSAAANVSEQTLAMMLSQFMVVQKTGGVATYIRLTHAGAGATGKIHWYCKWEKMSRDASLVAA